MTRITIKEEKKGAGRVFEVEITGHVRRREPERNDACVAASMLAQTMVQTLREYKDRLQAYEDLVDDDAHVYVIAITNWNTESFVRVVIKTIYTGFKLLKEAFPDDFAIEVYVGGALKKRI